MPVSIRAATPGDLPAVLTLLREARLPTDGVPEHFGRFLVAEDAGRIIGCAGLEIYPDADRRAALLRSVAVNPARRGEDLGQRLTRAALDRARADGVTEVALLTTTAQDFFTRFGFAPVPRETVNPALHASSEFQGACCETAVTMRLHLAPPAPGEIWPAAGAPAAGRDSRGG
ncbi:MAG: GNAT family N-acetyltransferase [Armatimonadetes bacterium]|nr:GNAT family N-acetyltransferase [Armatimonadota bacterium]